MSEALDLLAALRLEDGRAWGEAAVECQWADARAVLDPSSPTPYHYLTRARGFSKTGDLAGMNIAVLLTQAPERGRLYALAADQAQAGLILDAVGGFMSRTPELGGALVLQELKVVATRSGATLSVLPADAASVWGLKPYFTTIDELSSWHETPRMQRVFEAVTTGAAKVQGSRIVLPVDRWSSFSLLAEGVWTMPTRTISGVCMKFQAHPRGWTRSAGGVSLQACRHSLS